MVGDPTAGGDAVYPVTILTPIFERARLQPAGTGAPTEKRFSTDELWRHLIACPVNGHRSTRRDDRDVSHPVSAEPAGE